ncbi:MAG: adenosylcobinamide-phosphate synthase CbiB [Pseudomonadota bacterium]
MSAVLLAALVLEGLTGWVTWLQRRIRHPVEWMGWLIDRIDRAWNREEDPPRTRQIAGLLATLIVVGLSASLAWLVEAALPPWPVGLAFGALLAAPFLAAGSLWQHVAAVARPLQAGDIGGARRAVAAIVGRDPDTLEDAGIARAAIESLAENSSDGVVAPIFWGLLLGFPGLVGYKAINTLDSMIGHRTERHRDFGRAAARLDDLVNLLPARIAGGLVAIVSRHPWHALRIMLRDARRHRSPNAGWPEAAMAAALDCRLSGPRVYATGAEDAPWLNGEAPDPAPHAVGAALRVYLRAMVLLGALLFLLALW